MHHRDRMRRPAHAALTAGVVMLLVLAGQPSIARSSPGTSRAVDGRVGDWVGQSTLLGGTSQVSNGELVYQDYIYDDFGAAGGVGAQQRAQFSGRTDGTARYPTNAARYADNAADLHQLRLTTVGDDLWVLVRLNTLREPDTTVAAIAIDVDGDLSDTDGRWPREAGVATPGADRIITVWGDASGAGRGEVFDLDSGLTTPIADVAISTADEDNAIELKLPLALIGGTDWTMWAGTGLWDGDGWAEIPAGAPTETTPGRGSPRSTARLFNVAFREAEHGDYFDAEQAEALQNNDIGLFSLRWSPGAPDHAYEIDGGRVYEVIVDEGFSIPPLHEGASFVGEAGRATGGVEVYTQRFDFFGRWQPYGVYLPEVWDRSGKWPTLVALHGRGGTHGAFFEFGGGFQRDIGEGDPDDPMVIVTPLGRGRSHYESWGEADVLRVIDDAIARFAVDTDRISLGGYSMGGLGIYRLATMFPDRWATVVAWAGASSEYTGNYLTEPAGIASFGGGNKMAYGDFVHHMGNARYIPMLLLTGTNDEMLPLTGQMAPHRALDALDYRYRVDLYAGYGHLAWGAFDVWTDAREWIGRKSRTALPREVRYQWSDSIADPATSALLGIDYGNAWWVRDLERRDADPTDPEDPYRYGSITATSEAIVESPYQVVRSTTPQPEPHPHVRTGIEWAEPDPPVAPPSAANVLHVDLTNVRAATIDVPGAKLHPAGLQVKLRTDGTGVVHLLGDFRRLPTVVGPAVAALEGTGVRIELRDAGDVLLSFPSRPGRIPLP